MHVYMLLFVCVYYLLCLKVTMVNIAFIYGEMLQKLISGVLNK